jgi:hypothetical protein
MQFNKRYNLLDRREWKSSLVYGGVFGGGVFLVGTVLTQVVGFLEK